MVAIQTATAGLPTAQAALPHLRISGRSGLHAGGPEKPTWLHEGIHTLSHIKRIPM